MTHETWRGHYQRVLGAGKGWLDRLRAGDHVFLSSACGEPSALIDQLVEASRTGRVSNLTVFQMIKGGDRRLISAAGPDLNVVGLTYHPDLGEAAARGHASFLPISIQEIARSIDAGRLKFDVALIQTSPPDAGGNMSLGVSVDFAAQAVRQSRVVVAQVNDRSPRTRGDCSIHVSEIHAAVEVSKDLIDFAVESADEQGRRIAEHVLELVPDRSTIEMGIGAVMTAILEALDGRSGLGLHTGLLIEPMVDLIESGAITNEWKGIDEGVSVANQCRGTRRLYEFLDDNPAVSMRPASYTHDPRVLGALRNFRAINSAIEVDLLGQVNSEFVSGRRVSSGGGLVDFVRTAQAVDGARSIIALRSTTRRGDQSRIVSNLPAAVTLTADLADAVVTENGIADLRGLPSDKRADALIAIADERFRDQLANAVKSTGGVSV